jgi:hypothetical protein
MANYANVGFIDDNEFDDIYIRRDEYIQKGQVGTYDASTGDFGVLPAGLPGTVLTSDPLSSYGLTWAAPSGENITAGTPGAQSGSSRLTIVDSGASTTLAIATTGIIAGTYGSATSVPVVQFSNTGQALTCVDTPITFPAAPDQLASVATRNWGAGTSRNVGVQDNVAIGDGATTPGQESVAVGRLASAQTLSVAIGRSCIANVANATGVGPLVRVNAGNCVFAGGNIAGAGMLSTATNNVGIGWNILNGLTSGVGNVIIGSGTGSALTSGNSNVFIGLGAGFFTTTGGSNVSIGENSSPTASSTQFATLVGTISRAATNGTAMGYNARANGLNSSAYGINALSGGVNSLAFGSGCTVNVGIDNSISMGNSITNATANTALIGNNADPTNFIVRSTGYFRSARCLSAAAGQMVPDVLQVFPGGGAFTLVDIISIRFDNFPTDGASSVGLLTDRLFLGSFPQDLGGTFIVTALLEATASAASAWQIQVRWTAPGVIAGTPLGVVKTSFDNGLVDNLTLCQVISVPPTSTDRNYVEFYVRQQSGGAANLTTIQFRCAVSRLN